MYKVYCDDVLVHDAASPADEVHLINPKLKIGDCIAGSFECTIPPMNDGYGLFNKITSNIVIKKESKTIWTGRVIQENKDFYNRRKITAEGALAFLNDSNQGLNYYKNTNLVSFLQKLLNVHNSKVNPDRQFTLGVVTATNPDEKFVYETEYGSTWEELKKRCIDKIGGHIRVRYEGNILTPILDYLGDFPNVNTSAQEINFGKNLLDFTRNWDLTNLVTVVIPRGKQLDAENENGQTDYLTISDVNGGKNYVVNQQAYNTYGRIEKVVDFSDAEDANQLLQLGTAYVNALQFDEMVMEVSAIDLHYLTSSYMSFELLDQIRCISAPHGLDKPFPITEMDIPLDNPAGVTYTMGTNQVATMTGSAVKSAASMTDTIKDIIPVGRILDLAKENATKILNQRTVGYVNIVEQDEESQALVISDTKNWEEAQRYWKFDMNGLGYTSNGGERFDIAITMNGEIVADAISTGILSDGRGYNFWNLSTGEFSLGNTSKLIADSGDSIYLNDIVNLAQDTAIRRTGSENYFDGSGDWSQWRHSGAWIFDGENAQFPARSTAINDNALKPPAKCLKYATVKGYKLCLSFEAVSDEEWGELTSTNCLKVSFCLVNSSDVLMGSVDRLFSLDVNWKRKYTVLDMIDSTFKMESGFSNFNDAYLDVRFSVISQHQVTIRHIKLERGSVPTDWNVSTTDQDTYAYATASEAKDAALKYTDNQKEALDKSFTQEKVLRRLTNNFASQGIFMQNGELYINGSYVRTGTLDAGIIKAGILRDVRGLNMWNMVTGYLETTEAHFNRAQITGSLTSGDYYKIHIENGKLEGLKNGRRTGYIEATSQTTYIPTGAQWDGIQIQTEGCLRISSPHIAVKDTSNVAETTIVGYTGTARLPVVMTLQGSGDGSISWTYGEFIIECINGIVTAIGVPS